jgi:beta-N-acetylhexosaminidase
VPSDSPPRNVASPEQVSALCAALQAEAGGSLLIAVDQEGGRIARLNPDNGFPATPSPAELGEAGDVNATRAASEEMAATLLEAGFNVNFAPVVDLNTNPENPVIGGLDRSYSADPAVVIEQATAFIDGHHAHGLITTLKHFPGHGSSQEDSHLGFVDITETWDASELEPYRALVQQGKADIVMTAHVFNADLDPDYPASLSEAVINDLLREELGFQGVVISDDMGMGAITENYGFEEALRLAILAGADLLIYGNNIEDFDPNLGRRAYETVLDLVAAGDVPLERIEEAYRRIQLLKQRTTTL